MLHKFAVGSNLSVIEEELVRRVKLIHFFFLSTASAEESDRMSILAFSKKILLEDVVSAHKNCFAARSRSYGSFTLRNM